MTGPVRRQCRPCVPHTFSAVWLSRALSSPPGAEATASASSSPPRRLPSSSTPSPAIRCGPQPGDELDALSIERGDSGRYGSFYIVVMRKPDEEDFYKIEDALPLMADARGIYWHEDGPSWTAMKRYGNVVLAWDADQRELDDRFERLHTVLTGLGAAAGADPRQARRQAAPAGRRGSSTAASACGCPTSRCG